MSADDAVCPMHGAREPYTWGYSSKEPGCTCPETTPDETVSTDGAPFGYDQSHDQTPDDAAPTRCPRCAGTNGNHVEVHVRHGNGGGHNEPCPNAPTPDDAARAEAERLYPTRHLFRGAYLRGRADERAQAEGAGSSLSTQEGYEWLVDHDKQVRAHERARIAARRDEAVEAAANVNLSPPEECDCDLPPMHLDEDAAEAVANAVLAALGVSDR